MARISRKQPMPDASPDVTTLLGAWRRGDEAALGQLVPLVHDELHKRARNYMRRERPDHTLRPTALVNEAYLRLVDVRRVDWKDRAHFIAMAARQMRRVLVDAGRRRRFQKRGGGVPNVTFDEGLVAIERGPDLEALDDALEALADPRRTEGARRGAALFRRSQQRGSRRGARRLHRHGDAGLEGREAVAASGAETDVRM